MKVVALIVLKGIRIFFRSLFDALVDSLRRTINRDMTEMEAFLDLANAKLVTRPQTVAEVGEANAAHAGFREKRLQLIPFVKSIETRNKLLRQVNQGQGVEAINKLQVDISLSRVANDQLNQLK